MHDPFWENQVEHLLSFTTAEERQEHLLTLGPRVASAMWIMFEGLIQEALRELEPEPTE